MLPARFQQFKPKSLPKPKRPSKMPVLLFWLVALGAAAWFYYAKIHPALPDMGWSLPGQLEELMARARAAKPRAAAEDPQAGVTLANEVTLLLTNGRSVTGAVVRETPQVVTLGWDYGQAEFPRAEIAKIFRSQPASSDAAP